MALADYTTTYSGWWAPTSDGTTCMGISTYQNLGFWKFNESSGDAADSSGNSVTLTNANVTYAAGKLSNCAVFNGTNAKFTGTLTEALGSLDFTIAFWIKTASTATDGICVNGDITPASGHFGVVLDGASGKVLFQINGNTSAILSADINDDGWHHIVITRKDYNDFVVYSDGVAIAYDDQTGVKELTSTALTFGTSASNHWFTGSLDNFRIIKGYAWSQTDVNNDYNSGTGTDAAFAPGNPVITLTTAITEPETISNLIMTLNGSANNTITVQVSADNGSHYETVTLNRLSFLSYTGTQLKIRITVTKTNTHLADVFYGWETIFNIGDS